MCYRAKNKLIALTQTFPSSLGQAFVEDSHILINFFLLICIFIKL